MEVRAEEDRDGRWWVRGRIISGGVMRVTGEFEAKCIVNMVEMAYRAGREEALQSLRDLLDVPKRLEGED